MRFLLSLRNSLWSHPWEIALLATIIGYGVGYWGYTDGEPAASVVFGLSAGLGAYLWVQLRHGLHHLALAWQRGGHGPQLGAGRTSIQS